jgi:hypothetical protein
MDEIIYIAFCKGTGENEKRSTFHYGFEQYRQDD